MVSQELLSEPLVIFSSKRLLKPTLKITNVILPWGGGFRQIEEALCFQVWRMSWV